MTATLIDLWPGAHRTRWALLEYACELIEAERGWFTRRDIHLKLGGSPVHYGAASQVIDAFEAHGLLERSGHSSNGYRYRTTGGQR